VDDGAQVRTAIDRLLPERLQRLQRVSGAPVVFGGSTRLAGGTHQLVISRLIGTVGTSLRGLAVQAGRGVGGAVLRDSVPRRVSDYATTATITHDYDRIVVEEERLTSVLAVPVIVHGAVRGVLYGAAREAQAVGDRAVASAVAVAAQLQRDVEDLIRPQPQPGPPPATSDALAELADLIRGTADPDLRARLLRIQRGLGGSAGTRQSAAGPGGTVLAPRELDALRLAAVGASNLEIAAELGLSPETVKAYLSAAMRKLNVRNRTAAVHAARLAGVF
jgi:DNA-binding CsgD family transcriptional regulator